MSSEEEVIIPKSYTKQLSELGYSVSVVNDPVKLVIANADPAKPRRDAIPAGTTLIQDPCLFSVCTSESDRFVTNCSYCHQSYESDIQAAPLVGTIPKYRKCGACKVAYYCCRDDQVCDWKETHKEICPILKKWALSRDAGDSSSSPSSIIRAVLKYLVLRTKKPELEAMVNDFQMPTISKVQKQMVTHDAKSILDILPALLPPSVSSSKDASLDYLGDLISKLYSNSNVIRNNTTFAILGQCYCPWITKARHSCRPNAHCRTIMTAKKTWEVELIALRDLKPGEEITVTRCDVMGASVKLREQYGTFLDNEPGIITPGETPEMNIDESVYGVSLVSTRQKTLKFQFGFVCECEECLAAIADVRKYGFDPQLSFHCLKYPDCQGLIHLPLYPSSRVGFEKKVLKCFDCGFEIDPSLSENEIRKQIGVAPVTKLSFYDGDASISTMISDIRQCVVTLSSGHSGSNLIGKYEVGERLYEYLENSELLANPHKHNWEIARVYLTLLHVYCTPTLWHHPTINWETFLIRFDRMIKIVPLLESFYRVGVENDDHTEYFKLVDSLTMLCEYGSGIFQETHAQYLTPQQSMEFLEILMPILRRNYQTSKRIYGSDKNRSSKLMFLEMIEISMSKYAKYYSGRFNIPMSKHLKRLLRTVAVGDIGRKQEMMKKVLWH